MHLFGDIEAVMEGEGGKSKTCVAIKGLGHNMCFQHKHIGAFWFQHKYILKTWRVQHQTYVDVVSMSKQTDLANTTETVVV